MAVKVGINGQYWRFCKDWCMNVPNKQLITLKKLSEKGMQQNEKNYMKELQLRASKGSIAAKRAQEIRKKYFEYKEQLLIPPPRSYTKRQAPR